MRIVLLPSAYAPAVGGVEVLTAELAHTLQSSGHDVEVWTGHHANDRRAHREAIDGIPVRRFVFDLPRAAPRSLLEFPPRALSTLRELRRAAREFAPDVLHVQCFSGNGAYADALSRLVGLPLVVTLQGETFMDDHDIYGRSATLRFALRRALAHAAAVSGCSGYVLDDARVRFGLEPSRGDVIFNGISLDDLRVSEPALPFDRYVLGLGRVVKNKGFDLLLRAWAGIAARNADVGLVVAGDGAERVALEAQAAALGIAERVHFPGRLERDAVAGAMRGAEVFVMPSRVEPFGIVVLEAWRAQVPVVATSHGGVAEFVVDGESGLIVDPFDSKALASALQSLLDSPSLRRSLADAGCVQLPRFDWHAIATTYEAVYRRVIR